MNLQKISNSLKKRIDHKLKRDGLITRCIPNNSYKLLEWFYDDVNFRDETFVSFEDFSPSYGSDYIPTVEGGGIIEYSFHDTRIHHFDFDQKILDDDGAYVYTTHMDISPYESISVDIAAIPDFRITSKKEEKLFEGKLISIYETKVVIDWYAEVIHD